MVVKQVETGTATPLAAAENTLTREKGVVYVNGQFMPTAEARVSVFDHAFLYGDGVFDSCCIQNGYIFKLDEHLDRLFRSAESIRLRVPLEHAELRSLVIEAARRNELRDGYVKCIVTRGVSTEPRLDASECVPGLILIARPRLYLLDPAKMQAGLNARVVTVRRIPADCIDPKVKSLNYLNLALAKQEAIESGCDEAIMLDTSGYVCEGPGYNIFVYDGKILHTPARQTVLFGITRDTVFELAESAQIRVAESSMTPYDLHHSREVFFSSTAGGMIPITTIDGHRIGSGKPGPITLQLLGEYQRMLNEGRHGTPVW